MVMPFEDLSSRPKDHFADRVAQEILSNLIRFKEFVVFDARTSLEAAQADPRSTPAILSPRRWSDCASRIRISGSGA